MLPRDLLPLCLSDVQHLCKLSVRNFSLTFQTNKLPKHAQKQTINKGQTLPKIGQQKKQNKRDYLKLKEEI